MKVLTSAEAAELAFMKPKQPTPEPDCRLVIGKVHSVHFDGHKYTGKITRIEPCNGGYRLFISGPLGGVLGPFRVTRLP